MWSYEETAMDLQAALDFFVAQHRANVDWRPFAQDDPAKRPPLEKLLDVFRLAGLIRRPPLQAYLDMQGMKAELLKDLRASRLRAVGFLMPRSLDDELTYIPWDTWYGQVDWAGNTVRTDDLAFCGIVVLCPGWSLEPPRTPLDKPGDKTPADFKTEPLRRPGRPSRADQIEAAYEAVPKDYDKPLSAHFDCIRAEVAHQSRDDDGTGLSDAAIRKTIGKRFKAEQDQARAVEKL